MSSPSFEYVQDVVLPAVFERLDNVFPEMKMKRSREGWRGERCPSEAHPLGVRGDRVYVGRVKGGAPAGFAIAGGDPVSFFGYVVGDYHGIPRGKDFFRAAAILAQRAGEDPGPLEGAGPIDPEQLRRAREQIERERAREEEAQRRRSRRKIALAKALWQRSEENHPAVAGYFRARGVDYVPTRRLRYCADCPVGDRKAVAPAVVAMVTRAADEGEEHVAVHRIYLGADGGKHPEHGKWMLGPVRGGAVRLGAEGDVLVLCEGIETGMAIRAATGWPVWACLSMGGLLGVDLPASVAKFERVVVAGDFDDPGVRDARGKAPLRGQEAAQRAAERVSELFPGVRAAAVSPGAWWKEDQA